MRVTSLLQQYGPQIAKRDGGWKCFYCGIDLNPEAVQPKRGDSIPPDDPCVDHKVPRIRGGKDTLDNLVLSCRACNREKGTLTTVEYAWPQQIEDSGDLRKYRIELPNMADDDMDPYQFRLYGHYKRVCGANNGTCYESVRTTADKTKMSVGMVVKTREWLENNGWIKVRRRTEQQSLVVTIIDRWPENMMRYTKSSVHSMNTPRSYDEPKNVVVGVGFADTTEQQDDDANLTNIIRVYESNIGMIVEMTLRRLKIIAEKYPVGWFEEAVEIAVANNKRKLSYVEGILSNWETNGKDAPKPSPNASAPDPLEGAGKSNQPSYDEYTPVIPSGFEDQIND